MYYNDVKNEEMMENIMMVIIGSVLLGCGLCEIIEGFTKSKNVLTWCTIRGTLITLLGSFMVGYFI